MTSLSNKPNLSPGSNRWVMLTMSVWSSPAASLSDCLAVFCILIWYIVIGGRLFIADFLDNLHNYLLSAGWFMVRLCLLYKVHVQYVCVCVSSLLTWSSPSSSLWALKPHTYHKNGWREVCRKKDFLSLFLALWLFLSWLLVSYVSSFLRTSIPQWLLFSSLFLSNLLSVLSPTPSLFPSIHHGCVRVRLREKR